MVPNNPAELDESAFSCNITADTALATPSRATLLTHEENLTKTPLQAGNQVTLLVDGPATFKQQFADLRAAKHHIHLQTFILASDELGNEIADILIERASNGVEVRVIYDALGSMTVASKDFFKRLRNAGVELFEFRPLDPLEMLSDLDLLRFHNRSHRKLLIVDGRVGYTGGINVNNSYLGSAVGSSALMKTTAGATPTCASPARPLMAYKNCFWTPGASSTIYPPRPALINPHKH